MKREIDRCSVRSDAGSAPACRGEEEAEVAKLSIYWPIYVPTLTYGHELWVVTKERDHEYLRPKWASGCLGSPLEIGGEAQSSGRGSG